MLSTRHGAFSVGRSARTVSARFLALRRLARSGSATITTSSTVARVCRTQAFQACGMSSTTIGMVFWQSSSTCSNSRSSKS
ncbi:hypothetical protein D3C72_2478370 [compost metagenome]